MCYIRFNSCFKIISNNFYPFFNNNFLKHTEDVIDGFQKVIDIQPASWYYLQQCLKYKYQLKLDKVLEDKNVITTITGKDYYNNSEIQQLM